MLHFRWRKITCGALAALCLGAALPGGAEEALDGETNLRLEARLSELGFFTEAPDETGDDSTWIALGNYQTANGLEPTGSLNAETVRSLRSDDSLSKQAYLTGLAARYATAEFGIGASGREVSSLQQQLGKLGYYSGKADGVFGEATSEAVSLFQISIGLPGTGVADGATLYRLAEGEPMSREEYLAHKCAVKGDSGARVKLAQQRLRSLGYFGGDCTGAYGDLTAQAVEEFQLTNELPVNGQLDLETCAVLYSNKARRPEEGSLQLGSAGESMREMQARLAELGYYTGPQDGVFDANTQTALCLYRIANGDRDGEDPLARAEAAEVFRESREQAGAETLEAVALLAESQLGQSFAAGDAETRFPGFAFVQAVFARNGVAFGEPGEIVGETGERIERDAAPEAGSIVVLEKENEGGARLCLTISLGGGRLAYPDESGQYIISGELGQADFVNAYVWAPTSTGDGE